MPLLNLIQQDIAINNEHGVYYVTSFHWSAHYQIFNIKALDNLLHF